MQKEEQRKSELRREASRKDPTNKENMSRYRDYREHQNQSRERFSKERTRPSQKPIVEETRGERQRSFYLTEKEGLKDRSYFEKTVGQLPHQPPGDRKLDSTYGKLAASGSYNRKK